MTCKTPRDCQRPACSSPADFALTQDAQALWPPSVPPAVGSLPLLLPPWDAVALSISSQLLPSCYVHLSPNISSSVKASR